jgi:acetyl esterase/lipase
MKQKNFMKRIQTLSLMLLLVLTVSAAQSEKSPVVNLWPAGAPNSNGVDSDSANVQVFLPDAKRATGRAIVICPGGAYAVLAMGHEGVEWAPFFNNQGIAVFVLKYRMPHGNCEVPIADAEQAIRLVRQNAAQWHVDVNQVGIMGSSAGGHLASTIATHSKGDAAPNFQILFYPVITMDPGFSHKGSHDNFLGSDAKKKQEKEYSNDLQVTRSTPRAFIALSDDDDVVLPANGVNYYLECYRHDVPASLHVYPSGGHGWGIHESFEYHLEMMSELRAWLKSF